jgi:hypothetical protein
MNEGNLIPNSQRTPSQLREQARNAGIALGEARRQKRRHKEIAETILSIQISAESVYKYSSDSIKAMAKGCSQNGLISVKDWMVISQIEKAVHRGDTRAFEVIRNIVEEEPKERRETSKTYNIQAQVSALR